MTDPLRERLQLALGRHYTLERELGGGGMSRVFVAREEDLGRDVVVKVLAPELAEGVSVERFAREIKLAASLQAPHIVPVLTAGTTDDGLPYYTMPFVTGESLRARLARGPLPLAEALTIVRDVALALEYAHTQGVVHRDIKPENVLLSGRTAMVADFGIAKALSASRDVAVAPTAPTALTRLGTAIGTPAYMAPEQASGEPTIDHRADLYAWAMLAWEVIGGRHPFAHRTTAQALLVAQFTEVPPSLASVRPDVPPAVSTIVHACLEKDAVDRPADASVVLAALDGDMARVPTPTRSTTSAAVNVRSLVVLPFATVGSDADTEYFGEGLTEELITDLGRLRGMRVISRTSAMAYRDGTRPLREIAAELGVRFVLEGSVRRAGPQLRITARLVDGATEAQVWAEGYRGTLEDVFDLQERVSRDIVRALDVALTGDEDRQLARRSVPDAEAFDAMLRARAEARKWSADALARAAALLDGALARLPDNPRLLVERLRVTGHMARGHGAYEADVVLDLGRAAHALLARHPEEGSAQLLLGMASMEVGRVADAVTQLRAAWHHDPQDPDSGVWLGIALLYAGHLESAHRVAERMMQQDPLSPMGYMVESGVRLFGGDPEASLVFLRRTLELGADSAVIRWQLVYTYVLAGRLAEADAELARLSAAEPDHPYVVQALALLPAVRGAAEAARPHLERLAGMTLDNHITFHVAECYALLGDVTPAFALLRDAMGRGFHPADFMARINPLLHSLRGRPEFAAIVADAERRCAAVAG